MTKFTFWKNNKADQEFELAPDEVKQKFIQWIGTKDLKWLEYYYPALEQFFIADPDGLSSVPNEIQKHDILQLLYPIKVRELKGKTE